MPLEKATSVIGDSFSLGDPPQTPKCASYWSTLGLEILKRAMQSSSTFAFRLFYCHDKADEITEFVLWCSFREMGGHHGPQPPKIPDWRIYRVEDVPQLMQVKKALAQHGLCDPWLRNEVWKYTEFKNKNSFSKFLQGFVFRGFKYGAAAGVVTAAIEYAFFPLRQAPGHDEHGHQ